VLLSLLKDWLELLDESFELELDVLSELGVSSLLVLEESNELELEEYSCELELGDPKLLEEDSLASVELLLLDESFELEELDSVESEIEVRLDSEVGLDELDEDIPPIDKLDSLEELYSIAGL